jgi:hypothetical protein
MLKTPDFLGVYTNKNGKFILSMSLFYLYRFKFAVKLQIIMFENAIIGHFATRAVSEQFWPCCWEIHQAFYFFTCASSAPPPNHLVPVFSCEKPLNIKKNNKRPIG